MLRQGAFNTLTCFLLTMHLKRKPGWAVLCLRNRYPKRKDENRKIILFKDNCSSHILVNVLTNTKLIFLLPNCTSKLQPADQAIIQNLKDHYHMTMIRKMLQCLDDKPAKTFVVMDAVFMMAKAWESVNTRTISNCGRKALFPNEVVEPKADPFVSGDEDEEEIKNGLWGSIKNHFPTLADISFSNFLH